MSIDNGSDVSEKSLSHEKNKIVVHESFVRGADKREVWEPRGDGRYLRRTYRWRDSIDDWWETGSVVVEQIAIRDHGDD